jgi:hypothetical protein
MTPKELLINALQSHSIQVLADRGKFLDLEKDYTVEVEANGIYKLLWLGKVVAPFGDLEELCEFVKS